MKKAQPKNADCISKFNGFICSRTGLEFPRSRFNDLEAKANEAALEFGFSTVEAFIEHTLSSPPSADLMERLVSLLTNGETYFWREPLMFEALLKSILPELLSLRTSNGRYLRIWSAGCSSGEEPYSIAIALRSAIPDLERWRISILATDINTDSLRKASLGVYGEWSFRNAPAELVERNFRLLKDGKREILPEIREMVSFARLNLAEDDYPSPSNGTDSIDIVFCRNVLMYFSPGRAAGVGNRLHDCLTDGGWLLVGASELSQSLFPRFRSVRIGDVFAYRKSDEPVRPPKAEFIWPDPISAFPDTRAVSSEPEPVPAPAPRTENEQGENSRVNVLALAKALADRGDLDDALALCEKALSSDKLDPSLHYLKAAVLQEMGRSDDAFRSLERTLYVDPEFVLAHFALGSLAMRRGDRKTGTRCFRNALALVEPLSDSDVLPESAGLAVGRFREIVRSVMQGGVSA